MDLVFADPAARGRESGDHPERRGGGEGWVLGERRHAGASEDSGGAEKTRTLAARPLGYA